MCTRERVWRRGLRAMADALKVEDLSDEDLDRIRMYMSPAAHAAGYYEVSLNTDFAIATSSVWVPVAKAAARALKPVGSYKYTVHWSKKMVALTQGWVRMPCLGSFDVTLPAGDTLRVDPEARVDPKPIGAVLLALSLIHI